MWFALHIRLQNMRGLTKCWISWETTKILLIVFGHSWFDCLQWVWEVSQWMIEQTIILYAHDLNRTQIWSKQWIRWWQLLSASSVYNVLFKYLNPKASLLECLRACDLVRIWDAALLVRNILFTVAFQAQGSSLTSPYCL